MRVDVRTTTTTTTTTHSFREHRGDSAQKEDIVCGIRNKYGGGASATEGDVWGACWGQGLLRGAKEGLVGASEGEYVGLKSEIRRVAKGCSEGRQMVSKGRGGSRVVLAEMA